MLHSKRLHLITPTIPYPPNFGGAVDVFYRIVALKKVGVNIHLHCFKYDRDEAEELEKHCEKVYYYDRKLSWVKLFSRTPFIINSRANNNLTERLRENPYPILFDGLHCTYTLKNIELKQKKFIRPHNVETNYFNQLAKSESNIFKKTFFYSESLKLFFYERKLAKAKAVFSISINDHKHFCQFSESHLVRAFHSNTSVQSKLGKGNYTLYHGNMTVSENVSALRFLMDKVFPQLDTPIIVAGKIKSQKLIKRIQKHLSVKLIENPNQKEMDRLIQNAHVILLPTFQNTGIKLKLLESLLKGRFCIANTAMIKSTELEQYCLVANSPEDWINIIKKCNEEYFSPEEIEKRESIISEFNNELEAKKIVKEIFED